MNWNNIIQTIVFLSLTGCGIVGNILKFLRLVYTSAFQIEKKPVNLILIHLVFSNMIIICSTGIRNIATVFYFRNFLGDIGCKAIVYLTRMARGLSICTTCHLSMVQAVTISPRTTIWKKLKPQTSWQVLTYVFFWILNILTSSNLLYYITASNGMNRSEVSGYIGYCYMLPSRHIVKWIFLLLMAVHDLIFQSLMGWSSGYISLHLYKHHKRVLYLHSCRFIKSFSPEIRAAQSVVILMSCFLFFYWADFIFFFYTGSMVTTHDSIILNIKTCLVLGYAILSPFVLMNRDGPVAKS